jgi:hypothetical protein
MELRMDATPDKVYYVPLPQLPRLHMRPLPRLPHLRRVPVLPFSARLVRGRRRLHRSSRTPVVTWSAAHSLDMVLWTLALVLAVGIGAGIGQL